LNDEIDKRRIRKNNIKNYLSQSRLTY